MAEGRSESEERRWFARVSWFVLPAVASAMLMATTNHACQDVAAVPFLWIVPLSLYLLSFVLCFDHPRWYRRGFFALGTVILLLATAGIDDLQSFFEIHQLGYAFLYEMGLYFGSLFFLCMVCHGELAGIGPRRNGSPSIT